MGTRIARAIDSGEVDGVLERVHDAEPEKARALAGSLARRPTVVENHHLLSSGPGVDLVVEAASQDAVRSAALSVIQNRKDMVVMSVGALLDEPVYEVLADACAQFGRTIYLPSGAVAGLDALRAVRGELESVTLTTTKHPRSLAGAPGLAGSGIDLGGAGGPTTVFEGDAAAAVRSFPANVNVAALLALAGAGAAATSVRIVADPAAERNSHRIDARGRFGEIAVEVRNVPDPGNPRTSRLAILSAIATLRGVCSGGGSVRVGT